MTSEELWLLSAVIFAGYAIQTSIGFGAALVTVSIASSFLPIESVVAVVVPISVLQSGYIAGRYRRDVAWQILWTRVLPLMGIALVIGAVIVRPRAGPWLELGVGAIVLAAALSALYTLLRGERTPEPSGADQALAAGALTLAGIAHGVAAIGGPPLVYALERLRLKKAAFRSTLSVVWVVSNVGLVSLFVREGRYPDPLSLWPLLVGAGLGIIAGELVFARLPERAFRVTVNVALLVAAGAIVARHFSG